MSYLDEITVNQFAAAVGRPQWVIKGWCVEELIPARLTYGLEPGEGRSEKDRAIGDPDTLVKEFVLWMQAY